MTPEDVAKRLETLGPETKAVVTDFSNEGNHYKAVVISPAFAGQPTMERHRAVYRLLDAEMKSGEIHALVLKTYTPEQYAAHH